jgi:hypothetical protein
MNVVIAAVIVGLVAQFGWFAGLVVVLRGSDPGDRPDILREYLNRGRLDHCAREGTHMRQRCRHSIRHQRSPGQRG